MGDDQKVSGPISPSTSDASTARLPPKEGAALKEIYGHYNSGEHAVALEKMSAFEKKFPKSTQLPQIHNLHGLVLLITKRAPLAIPHFRRAIELSPPTAAFNHYVLYNLATAQFEASQINECQQSLEKINLDSLDKENRIKVHYLRSRAFVKRGFPLESTRESLAASRLFTHLHASEHRDAQSVFITLLEQSLGAIKELPTLESLYKEYEDSPLADVVLFHLGKSEIAMGNTGSGEIHLRMLMTRHPQSSYYASASEMIRSAQVSTVIDRKAVGVLLPMKGKFAKFGASSLQSIELAFRIFNLNEEASKLTLVVEDSGDEPEQAIKALDKLVFKHHVAAVIGPLLSKGIDQVTQRAQELGVPLVSLARSPGISGDYIFQAGMTLQLQAREVARYAIEQLGIKKFAMAYPRDKVGEATSQHFWDAVESMGGQVVGAESYVSNETDFKQVVDRLSGLYYTEGRHRELEALAKLREENNIRRLTRKTEQYFKLTPIVEYEAVFIPDEPKVAGQMLPTFAYRDVDKIRFLGLSAWNSPEFLTRAQGYCENAVFVDAFHPETTSPVVRKFVELYKATYNQEPTAMDAMAYDAAHVVETILSGAGDSENRSDIRDRLKGVRSFAGVTGKISYQDGQFTRGLRVLTVKSGKIVEAQ